MINEPVNKVGIPHVVRDQIETIEWGNIPIKGILLKVILLERERCALIADKIAGEVGGNPAKSAAKKVASRIRNIVITSEDII